MVNPTFRYKSGTLTDPSNQRFGASDINYAWSVLDGTHATDRLQIENIEGREKYAIYAYYVRQLGAASYEAIRSDTGAKTTGTDFGTLMNTVIGNMPIPSSTNAIGQIILSGTSLDCGTTPITINKSNIIIDGMDSAIIRKTTDYSSPNRSVFFLETGAHNVILRDFTIDVTIQTGTQTRPIHCAPSTGASGATTVSNILIDNVRIKNAYNPVFFNAPSTSGRIIDNIVIRNMWVDNAAIAQTGPGIYLGLGCKNATVHHCYMIEPGNNAIEVTATGEFIKIWGNFIQKNTSTTGNGIVISNIGTITADQGATKYIAVRDNRILGPITLDGIRLEGAAEKIIVANNFINGGTRDGISILAKTISATDYWAKEIQILGNIIQNMGRHGVFAQSSNSAVEFQALQISNNYILETQLNGIELNSGNTKSLITNNMVYNYGKDALTNRAGIHLRLTSNSIVTGNQIFGLLTGQGSPYWGIWEENTSNNNVITSNSMNYPISFIGANTIIAFNDGFKTEAAGTTSIADTATTVAVTHGLGYTPALKDIYATPTSAWGNTTNFWVSSPTSTQFTINVSPAPGSGNTMSFSWQAIRGY